MVSFAVLVRRALDVILPEYPDERVVRASTPEDVAGKLSISTYKDITCLFPYRDPLITKIIWALKYRGNTHAADLLSDALYDFLLEDVARKLMYEETPLLLIPIPLSKARLRERGFNHMDLVAKRLAKRLPQLTHTPNALFKIRHTKPQTTLPKNERLTNLQGVFTADEKMILSRSILLIDDVATTGSTLSEAKQALLHKGAIDVRCIAIAH